MRVLDCVKPLLMGHMHTMARARLQEKKGKSHVLDFPIIVPRFPVMLILDRRKILLNGPVTAS